MGAFNRLGKMLTAAVAGVVLLGGGLAQVHPAHAFAEWCFDDPVVSINGTVLTTLVGAYGDPSDVAPHIAIARFVYVLPSNVTASVISDTNTYMHEKVAFSFTGPAVAPGQPIPVTVSVAFNASESFPTQLQNSENGMTLSTVTGSTDSGMTASFTLQ